MKKLKPFRRPRLYFQLGQHGGYGSRIRIIYPDGSCEWISHGKPEEVYAPCWAERLPSSLEFTVRGKCSSAFRAIELMHKYDFSQGFPEADFIGEL